MRDLLKYLSVIFLFCTLNSRSQVSVNVNTGTPPWGFKGNTEIRYYYLPDIETYYDVNSAKFIYWNKGTWVYSAELPVLYNLHKGSKVVLDDYSGSAPYIYYHSHKSKHPKGYKTSNVKKVSDKPRNALHASNSNEKKGSYNISGHGKEKH